MRRINEAIIQERGLDTSVLSLSSLTASTSGITVTNFNGDSLTTQTVVASSVNVGSLIDTNNAPILDRNREIGLFVDASNDGLYFTGGPYNIEYQPMGAYPFGNTNTPLTRLIYRFTGDDQQFVVPNNVFYIFAKLWGAGGGAGRAGGWTYGGDGGGGGHTRGVIQVNPGETLTLVVGQGGTTAGTAAVRYGGGGVNLWESDDRYSGTGGGYAGIFRGSKAPENTLLIAGGGGGGGSMSGGGSGATAYYAWENCNGGAGGGVFGHRGECPRNGEGLFAGSGGTQTGAGYAYYREAITRGSFLLGGCSWTNGYGGGGGAGFMGGGGAGPHNSSMGGGGGGSGYVHPTVLFGSTFSGSNYMPAFFWDADIRPHEQVVDSSYSSAYGALNIQNNSNQLNQYTPVGDSGGHAIIVIYY